MSLHFIFQGLTPKTHLNALREMLAGPADRAIISVAFASEAGVSLIENELKSHAAGLTAFVGIRNAITSAQALRRLLSLGVNLYAVDTGSASLLFHPKLYHVRTATSAELVVGSANLTAGGLNNNVEASFRAKLDLTASGNDKLVKDMEALFDNLSNVHPDNVIPIQNAAEIDTLLVSGRVTDEAVSHPPRANSALNGNSVDPIPRMKMKVPPIGGGVKPASNAVPAKQAGLPVASAAPSGAPTAGVEYELVWVSKKLERRDLNIPDGENTARTGSINLDRGQLEGAVDHRHYFREVVFSELSWPTTHSQVDLAQANFGLVIKGVHHGTFTLTVRHTTSTTSKSYLQNNAMTRISWGKAKPLIAREDLRHRFMSLYRDRSDKTQFLIQID